MQRNTVSNMQSSFKSRSSSIKELHPMVQNVDEGEQSPRRLQTVGVNALLEGQDLDRSFGRRSQPQVTFGGRSEKSKQGSKGRRGSRRVAKEKEEDLEMDLPYW